MPNAALLIRGAPHPDEARAFIDFLISAGAEQILAASDAAQYPLHPGLKSPALLPPLDTLRVMDVDYGDVARQLADDAIDLAESVMTLNAGRLAPSARPWEDE